MIHRTKITKPDIVEITLILILAVWSIITLWLLEKAITFPLLNSITWQSLTTLFAAFASIVLLVIAVLVADIRKEIKHSY